MFDWKKWLLFVLLGFVALVILLSAITYGIKNYFGLNSADTLAFAQLFLSLLLLPTVLVGFFITVQAFRESQDLPDLDLFLETKSGVSEKSLKFNSSDILQLRTNSELRYNQTEQPIAFVIKNTGNAIAVWYAIRITIQYDVAPPSRYLNWNQFYGMVGDYWHLNHEERERNNRFEGTFTSNGSFAAYPNMPEKICEMNTGWFLVENTPTKAYEILYTITTDRGYIKQGLLKLKFQGTSI
ncbi:MAG TPA: hypothetical protein VEP90_24865 [Methylomirabilota bacterium]|nr:hypothetical protein [Methylomirabilota bacterium]